MDVLNFISWVKGSRIVTSVDGAQTLLPVGLRDPKRDDGYLAGAISVTDFLALSPGLPSFIQYNETDKGLWNNGPGSNDTNLSFGENSLSDNSSGTYITAIGTNCLSSSFSGYINTGLGYNALTSLTTGSSNTGAGAFSLNNLTTGIGNVALGKEAGFNITTGSYNVLLGAGANAYGGVSQSVVIGNGAVSTSNNELVIGASGGYRLGVITTESLTPTIAWKIKINGVYYKIPLQLA